MDKPDSKRLAEVEPDLGASWESCKFASEKDSSAGSYTEYGIRSVAASWRASATSRILAVQKQQQPRTNQKLCCQSKMRSDGGVQVLCRAGSNSVSVL